MVEVELVNIVNKLAQIKKYILYTQARNWDTSTLLDYFHFMLLLLVFHYILGGNIVLLLHYIYDSFSYFADLDYYNRIQYNHDVLYQCPPGGDSQAQLYVK